MRPAARLLRGDDHARLRVLGEELGNHAHGKLDRNLAAPALFQLIAQPPVDFLVTGLETGGDLFEHLRQGSSSHRPPSMVPALGGHMANSNLP